MLKDELLACCKRLRLSRNLADNSELVEADSREEYLLTLLKLEIGHREKGRREKYRYPDGEMNRFRFPVAFLYYPFSGISGLFPFCG